MITSPSSSRRFSLRWPLAAALLLTVLAATAVTGDGLSLATLKTHRADLLAAIALHPVAVPLAFIGVYAAATALSIPGAALLTVAAGFLFGPWLGGACAVIGATLGAVAVFLAARGLLAAPLRRLAGPWLTRLEHGFADDAFNYLLALRLVPLFPFWLVNLVPAFLGMGLWPYIIATVLGIIPGAAVYALAGNGLGAVFAAGGDPALGALLFSPTVLGPILGLAALALLPVLWRRRRTRS